MADNKTYNIQKTDNALSVEAYNRKSKDTERFLAVVDKAKSLATSDLSKLVSEIPNFSEVVKTTFAGVRYTYDETIKRNDEVVKKVSAACEKKMDALDKMLEDDNLTNEEKIVVVQEMSSVIDTLDKLDKRNKHFIEESKVNSNGIIMGTLGVTATVVLAAIGILSGRKK